MVLLRAVLGVGKPRARPGSVCPSRPAAKQSRRSMTNLEGALASLAGGAAERIEFLLLRPNMKKTLELFWAK
eukprot:2973540-Lingulodinium_polyedra.AAC.1